MTSSPLRVGASVEEELDYYKKQYEQLETDLADFQASSKELEEQLERDIETAEKSERKLKEQVERLNFEVEEWKTKHKQAKTEANTAQNALQKEITSIREANRGMQLKLRDIEVMNDDYERQARNTESSLEDVESRYNAAIERGVLLDEEVGRGEQERQDLRIETQRLRDELADLKVESEITLEKLRLADETIERLRSRKPSPLAVQSLRARSPVSEASGITPSPTASTPPAKSEYASEAQTPPSPPLSDAPILNKTDNKTPMRMPRRSLIPDASATPRASTLGAHAPPKHMSRPSLASNGSGPTSDVKAIGPPTTRSRLSTRPSMTSTQGLPRSESLYQIRNLRGRMQKIEERVHSARSKLPASRNPGTPKGSPRPALALGDDLPTSVTMRRSIRRPSSNFSFQADKFSDGSSDVGQPNRRTSGISRLSFGIPRPSSSAAPERPPSALDRPPSAGAAAVRPSSRSSLASSSATMSHRPGSRAGTSRPPFESFARGTDNATFSPRSSSALGGKYGSIHGTPRSHRPSASVSELRRKAAESEDSTLMTSPTPRGTFERPSFFSPTSASKRQSGGLPAPGTIGKRTSIGVRAGRKEEQDGAMMPPPARKKMSDVGETY